MRQQTTHPTFPNADQIEELTEAILSLHEQVRLLRLSVDEIEQELGWAIRAKVLDRLPRPEYPCDERFELPVTDDGRIDLEHACDPDGEIVEPAEARPPAPTPRRNQAKLW